MTMPLSQGPLAPVDIRLRLGAYARLAKLDVWDYYLALPLAWSLAGFRPSALVPLLVFGLGTVLVVAGSVAFDDVTGYRDGSDAANYGPDAPARKLARKPLLTGELSEAEAIRFGWLTAGAGAGLWVLAFAVAPFAPLWTILVAAVCLASSVQYSWGLKISYRGWQEVFLVGFGAGLVLVGTGLSTGGVTGFGAVQAVLFGLGPLLFGVYSNTRDAEGDAAVGRPTVAAVLGPLGNKAFIAGLTVAEVSLVVTAAGLGPAPWWFGLAMLPAMGVRVAQLRRGVGLGDLLAARSFGLRAHRSTTATLIAVNLILLVGAGS
ncbi:UbiA family prenyltransferase [Actinokineospora diospyrosa]|uniref:1,4-dihydroxy-2-naphthoate octaprenyltransferase n=1 Tax=Actinokineospora diospyrosa TaxID=103728 RepID=A0ABT1I7W9_9PSEU|nr:UbiA family prenyltransferase [Actinokineospora diospyrosa]MCP2268715.1 1,4-dihydroxy-2-naphthoate octaprenyltransferase [Actinokineospora diospyrosa]